MSPLFVLFGPSHLTAIALTLLVPLALALLARHEHLGRYADRLSMNVELPGRLLENRTTVRAVNVSGPPVTSRLTSYDDTDSDSDRVRASSWVRFIPGTTAILARQIVRARRSVSPW